MSASKGRPEDSLENGDVVEIKGVHYMMCEGKLFETKFIGGEWCLGEDAVRHLASHSPNPRRANRLLEAMNRAKAEAEQTGRPVKTRLQ